MKTLEQKIDKLIRKLEKMPDIVSVNASQIQGSFFVLHIKLSGHAEYMHVIKIEGFKVKRIFADIIKLLSVFKRN